MSQTSYKMIPLDRVFAKLNREIGLEGVQESDVIEWVGEALEAIGTVATYEEALSFIEVINHQCNIPSGFHNVIQIAKNNEFNPYTDRKGICAIDLLASTDTVNPLETPPATCPVVIDCNGQPITDYELAYYRPFFDLGLGYYGWTHGPVYKDKFSPVRLANSNLYDTLVCRMYDESQVDYNGGDNYTIIRGEVLRFNFKEGQVALSYLRLPVDEETGYPLVPDNYEHLEAINNYIIFKLFKKQFYAGREGAEKKMMKAEADWQRYCGMAGNYDMMPKGIDQLENLKDQTSYLIPRMSEYSNFFGRLGKPENRRFNNPDGRGKGYGYFRGIV